MPHSSLRSFVSTLLLVVVTLQLAAQVPTGNAPAPAPTDDPFAVLAAKKPQPPERAGMRIVVQKPDGSPAQDAIVVFTPWRDDAAGRTERAAADQQHLGDEPRILLRKGNITTRLLPWELGNVDVPEAGTTFVVELTRVRQEVLDQQVELLRNL